MGTNRSNRTNRQLGEGTLELQRVTTIQVHLMRCNSPFDNGSCHIGTNRSNRTNRQLGEGSLDLQRVRNILSPPNEMHFSIRQRVVSHGHDSYESNESTTRVRHILSPPNEMHFSIRQRVVPHGYDSYESNESTTRRRVSWPTSC